MTETLPTIGPTIGPSDPVANLTAHTAQIAVAARAAGRDLDQHPVIITAVTKKHDVAEIRPVLAAGHRTFGENRIQEAMGKWPALREQWPECRLHLIGPLQSNKAREAVAFFDVIETVDRPKIARAIADEIQRQGRTPDLLVQINSGQEQQKAGIAPDEAEAFIAQCQGEFGLTIAGLMCIPPVDQAPAPHFALLEKIARDHDLPIVSMGMSGDFLTAVKLGATHVRLGTAIFGTRQA